jgi:hypothetical protein
MMKKQIYPFKLLGPYLSVVFFFTCFFFLLPFLPFIIFFFIFSKKKMDISTEERNKRVNELRDEVKQDEISEDVSK